MDQDRPQHPPLSVSVVIACRNSASTLGLQLEALAGQTYEGCWEVIVSDNGSTDALLKVVDEFRDRLPGLRVIDSSGRLGAGCARNAAAETAKYEYLAFCDADDEVTPTWLAALAEALQENDFVAGRFEPSKLNARRSRTLQQDSQLQTSPFGPGLPHAGAGNMGIRRSVFLAVGGFDQSLRTLEDTDLCWRVQLAGHRLVFAPRAIVHVRLRSGVIAMWRQGAPTAGPPLDWSGGTGQVSHGMRPRSGATSQVGRHRFLLRR
ncbi:glycosyltransferase [Kineosporia sp. J2-2]|uniref:Glycosyltransferase n=1 Tax=Kineosporia corallincola TaxID=2835133 RepID=A0ABS5TAU7_9ACTN|nr:glycosyltransferase [Kineosporia corallincola]MBT0768156.1 glycosyltransferase [Kineosporia corallincola]